MTNTEFSISWSKEAKLAMCRLGESMNMSCYIYDAQRRNLEQLHKADAGRTLSKSVDSPPCARSYNVRR